MDRDTRRKRREYAREWRKRNPDKQRALWKRYYEKHKDRLREYQNERARNRTPEERERTNKRKRLRYATDPEFRKKMSESWKRWYQKNKKEYITLQPFTTGLECGFCRYPIKTNTSGRLGKGLIRCPECKCEQQRNLLKKVKIPRYITVIPTDETKTPPRIIPKPSKSIFERYPKGGKEKVIR